MKKCIKLLNGTIKSYVKGKVSYIYRYRQILMNYQRIYNQIIERAKIRQIEGYVEKHHIIPKCLGGNNEQDNLVKLTAREHFLCHRLLVEIYPNEPKLKYALYLMNIGKRKNKNADYKISSRTYERLKKEGSILISNWAKNRKLTEGHKEILYNYHFGAKRNEQWKQNMRGSRGSQPNMKIPKSEKYKENLRTKMRGKSWTVSDEALKNKREQYKNNLERNKKISNSNKVCISQFTLDDVFIKDWESIKDINLFFNKQPNASSVSLCCKGIYKQAFGYKWKYK